MVTPKFIHNRTHFQQDLKKRVHQYFIDQNKPTTGNFGLYFKACFFFFLYVGLYIHLVYFTPPNWQAMIECVFLGLSTAGIGFNIMHDGGHGSFSKNKTLNNMAAFSVNFVGASAIMWNMKHNIIHHTYTNIDGVDDDIEIKPYLRMCRTQPLRPLHKFQHYYFWFLYTFLHILWIFLSDYQKYFSGKIGIIPIKKMSFREHVTFWVAKIAYIILYMAIPIYLLGFSKWFIGFLITSMVTGFVISIVFQLAHTVEETEFPVIDENTHHIENEWAIHQIHTTANFATKSKLVSWLVGGLNFQVEHHLFPKISHIHYPAINNIVKQTCNDYGLHYLENPSLAKAIISHVHHLKRMGRAS
jgi:linoleoyl-CoA desaturase